MLVGYWLPAFGYICPPKQWLRTVHYPKPQPRESTLFLSPLSPSSRDFNPSKTSMVMLCESREEQRMESYLLFFAFYFVPPLQPSQNYEMQRDLADLITALVPINLGCNETSLANLDFSQFQLYKRQ